VGAVFHVTFDESSVAGIFCNTHCFSRRGEAVAAGLATIAGVVSANVDITESAACFAVECACFCCTFNMSHFNSPFSLNFINDSQPSDIVFSLLSKILLFAFFAEIGLNFYDYDIFLSFFELIRFCSV